MLNSSPTVPTIRRLIRRKFRDGMVRFLRSSGEQNPLKPLKAGGTVGNDTLSFVASNFLVNIGRHVRRVQEFAGSGKN